MSAFHSPSCACGSCDEVRTVSSQLEQLGGRKRLEARLLRTTAKVLLDEAATAHHQAETAVAIASKSVHPETKSVARQSAVQNQDKRDGLTEQAQKALQASSDAKHVADESEKHLQAIAKTTQTSSPHTSATLIPRTSTHASASRLSALHASKPHFIYADTGSDIISTVTSVDGEDHSIDDDDDDDDEDGDGEDHSVGDDSFVTETSSVYTDGTDGSSMFMPASRSYGPNRASARSFATGIMSTASSMVSDGTDATDASSIFAPRLSAHSRFSAHPQLSARSQLQGMTAFVPDDDDVESAVSDTTDSVVSEHAGGRFYRRRYW